jgi:hypothetical protein
MSRPFLMIGIKDLKPFYNGFHAKPPLKSTVKHVLILLVLYGLVKIFRLIIHQKTQLYKRILEVFVD